MKIYSIIFYTFIFRDSNKLQLSEILLCAECGYAMYLILEKRKRTEMSIVRGSVKAAPQGRADRNREKFQRRKP